MVIGRPDWNRLSPTGASSVSRRLGLALGVGVLADRRGLGDQADLVGLAGRRLGLDPDLGRRARRDR